MAEKEEKEFLYYQMINGKALYKCSNCVFEVKDFYRLKRHLCAKTGCLFEKNDKQIDQNLWELKSIRLVPEKLINTGGGKWQTKMRKAQMKVEKEKKIEKEEKIEKSEDEEKGENKYEMGVVTRKRKREQKEEMSGTKRTKDDVQKEKKNDRTKRGKEKDEEKMTNECEIEGTKKEEMVKTNGVNDWLEMRKNAAGNYDNKIAWKMVEIEKEIISEETEGILPRCELEKISKTVKIVNDEEKRLEIYESEEEELNEENEDGRFDGRSDLTLDCIDGLIQLGNGFEEIDYGKEENVIKIGQKNKMANELAKEGEDEEVENQVDNLFEDDERNEFEDKQIKERLAVEKEEKELAKKKSEIEEERKIKYWVLINGMALKINNFEEQEICNWLENTKKAVLQEIREEREKRELDEERQRDEQRKREEETKWEEEAKWEKKNRPKRSCVWIKESTNVTTKELKRKEKKDEKKLMEEIADLKREKKEALSVGIIHARWIDELESQRKKDAEEIRKFKIENEEMKKKLIEIEMEDKIKKWRKWLKKGKIELSDFDVAKWCIENNLTENEVIKTVFEERRKRESGKINRRYSPLGRSFCFQFDWL